MKHLQKYNLQKHIVEKTEFVFKREVSGVPAVAVGEAACTAAGSGPQAAAVGG